MERHIDYHYVHPSYGRPAAEARRSYRLATKLTPSHTLVPVMAELRLAWVRFQSRRPGATLAGLEDQLADIGCAGRGEREWIDLR